MAKPPKLLENPKKQISLSDWLSILSLVGAIISIIFSLYFGNLNEQKAQRAIDISTKALDSQGPIVTVAEEEMKRVSPGQYKFSFPLKNVGGRTATKMKTKIYFIGRDQNTIITYYDEQEHANDLAPTVTRNFSGALVVNPEPQFVVLDIDYADALMDKATLQKLFYVLDPTRGISELADAEAKKQIEFMLSK